MEVYRLNASLNWDDNPDARPWDLSDSNVDLYMKLFPTEKLSIPISWVQDETKQYGYSVGLEYFYNFFGDGFYEEDEIIEDDDEWSSVWNSFYKEYFHHSAFAKQNILERIEYHQGGSEIFQVENQRWTSFLQQFKVDNLQGVCKVFLQKPYDLNRSWPSLVFFNNISAVFQNNRLGFNFGYNLITRAFHDRFWLRRTILAWGKPLLLIGSVANPHDWDQMITTLSTGFSGWWLNYKNTPDKNSIYLSKRFFSTPFSVSYRQYLLETWKSYFTNQEVFEIPIPMPPIWENAIPPDLSLGISFLDRILNTVHQIGRIGRYFLDVQMSTVDNSFKSVSSWNNLKTVLLSKFYEQFYILSFGNQSRIITEYFWNKEKKGVRIPFEISWGCDLFRIWILLDLVFEYNGELKTNHNISMAFTLFEIYTLVERTFCLNPFFAKLVEIFRRIKSIIQSVFE